VPLAELYEAILTPPTIGLPSVKAAEAPSKNDNIIIDPAAAFENAPPKPKLSLPGVKAPDPIIKKRAPPPVVDLRDNITEVSAEIVPPRKPKPKPCILSPTVPAEHQGRKPEELEVAIAVALDVPAVPGHTYNLRLGLAICRAAPSWPITLLMAGLIKAGHKGIAGALRNVVMYCKAYRFQQTFERCLELAESREEPIDGTKRQDTTPQTRNRLP
jgi:hypothetical protein